MTVNGGTTWTARSTPGNFPDASSFIGADDGWVWFSAAVETTPPVETGLWVTHSAGRTWTNANATISLDGLSLDFLTTRLGWADTSEPAPSPPATGFLQTSDGGHTWTTVAAVISGP